MKQYWTGLLAVTIALALVAAEAPAAKFLFTKPFGGIGLGLESCGKMMEADALGRSIVYTGWITGAITGWNAAKGSHLAWGMDSEAIAAWTKNYCRAHPLDNITKAFMALIEELTARQGAG